MFGILLHRHRSLRPTHEQYSFQSYANRCKHQAPAGEYLHMSQISMPCLFAIGWRTEHIIKLQCLSCEFLSLPKVNCPIRFLDNFLVMWVSYTETDILHCSRGHSGRENMRTSLKTVTSEWATAEVFWYLNLCWLHCTLILAYRAVQHREGTSGTTCMTTLWPCLESYIGGWYLPLSEHISVRTVLTLSSPTSSLWEVGRNFKVRSTSPTRSCPDNGKRNNSA